MGVLDGSDNGNGMGTRLPAAVCAPPKFHEGDSRRGSGSWPPTSDPRSPPNFHSAWADRPSTSPCPSSQHLMPSNGYGLGGWTSTAPCSPPDLFGAPNGYGSDGGLAVGGWGSSNYQVSSGCGSSPPAGMWSSADLHHVNQFQNGQQLPPHNYIDPAAELQSLHHQKRNDFLVDIVKRKKQVRNGLLSL